MKNILIIITITFCTNLYSFANYHSDWDSYYSINDGPYIFKVDDKIEVKWIKNSRLHEETLTPANFDGIKKNFNLLFSYKNLLDAYTIKPNFVQSYRNVDSVCVISDIHGEYKKYIDLSKANGIIDNNLNWNFGKGHFVVLGDVFDRGDKVTEVLWHLFGLEKQAEVAGGKVHLLLGNHESMVLHKDLRYINEKYKKVETISNILYSDLYSEKSVLGNWLQSKPVIIAINDIIFVHAGLSTEIVQKKLKIKQINKLFFKDIVGKSMDSININPVLYLINNEDGPLWYRGYFTDTTFGESRLDSILTFYNKKHIVVGHTSNEDITLLYSNKIIGVDAGIMYKRRGEMLIYKNGFFYKGLINGNRIKL